MIGSFLFSKIKGEYDSFMYETKFMQLALQLAKTAKGQTAPNPAVGAVIVKNGEIVGVGTHLKAGEAHAEIHAINMAGKNAEGATLYVTLEPCSHYGKTPPCVEKIIEANIKRVIVGTLDPNPYVAGKGIQKLKNAGIDVLVGVCESEAKEINQDFFHYITTKRPFVTLKTAMTIDGKIATASGESKWITGDESRRDVHRYRHIHDAILVGVGTVLKDNPKLTTRLPEGGKHPIRIILDSHLRIPQDAFVIHDDSAPTWVVTNRHCNQKQKKLELQRFEHVKVIEMDDLRNLHQLLDILGQRGITSLFVEGGAKVNNSFLQAKLIDQFLFYIAPKIFGGSDAPTSFEGKGIERLKDAFELNIESVEKLGNDLKIVAKPIRS